MQQFKKLTNPLAVLLIAVLFYSCCHDVCFPSLGGDCVGVGLAAAFTTLPHRQNGLLVAPMHARSVTTFANVMNGKYDGRRITSSLGGGIQRKEATTTSWHRSTTAAAAAAAALRDQKCTVLSMGRWSPCCCNGKQSNLLLPFQQLKTVPLSCVLWLRQKLAFPKLLQKAKLAMAIFVTSLMMCLGPLHNHHSFWGQVRPPLAHASTAVATPTTTASTMTHARDVDKIVQQYVQKHMFQDDMYDPVESTYREIIQDSTTQRQYSKTLTSTLGSVLGKKTVAESTRREAASSDGQVIKSLLKLVDAIQEKSGLSKSVIIPALFLVGGGIPIVIILAGLMSFSYSQKAMTERMAIERYGESVLEAEELVVRDEDDEDEEDEDEDDEDDDDEDDEDDDDEEDMNDKKKKK